MLLQFIRFIRGAMTTVAIAAMVASSTAEAQLVRGYVGRGFVGRGVSVNVPGVSLRVGVPGIVYGVPRPGVILAPSYAGAYAPYGAYSAYGAYGAYGPAPLYGPGVVLPRRQIVGRAVVPPVTPPYASGEVENGGGYGGAQAATGGRGFMENGSAALPTEAELAAMDDSALLNAVVQLAAQLDAELGRFTTGAGWQKHLHLPADAFPAPVDNRVTLGFNSIRATLERFDAVAETPAYAKISGVPSFASMRAALAEVVRRYEDQAPTGPSGETLPTPSVTPPPVPTPPRVPPQIPPQTPPQTSSTPSLAAPQNGVAVERSVLAK